MMKLAMTGGIGEPMETLSIYRNGCWNRRTRRWECVWKVLCCHHQTTDFGRFKESLISTLWRERWHQSWQGCHSVGPKECPVCGWNPKNSSHGAWSYSDV